MRFGSVCSGIEAASMAWGPLGWVPSFYSEIDPFARAVLQYRHHHVPLHGDFTTIENGIYEPVDLLAGGTPCQSFSLAGLRKGFTDQRGNLTLEFIRLAERLLSRGLRWLVWENVPGVLSSNGGRDFAAFLGGLAELGFGFAYRVLDAQYFGVPQRRRRVVLVAYLGDWRVAAAVLFERQGLRGDITPRRTAGEVFAALTANGVGTCGVDDNQAQAGHLIAYGGNNSGGPIDVATALNAHGGPHGRMDFESETFITSAIPINTQLAMRHKALGEGTGLGIGDPGDPAFTLQAAHHHAVAVSTPHTFKMRGGCEGGGKGYLGQDDKAFTLSTLEDQHLFHDMRVRRLTPLECERLQGFPDGYTDVPYRRRNYTPDGPRYKALGNSWAVPKFRWLGERIQMVEEML